MVQARIADDGANTFSAHVEYEQSEPFCFLPGPTDVGLAAALAWGRAHAATVVVRIGDTHYTAGRRRIPDLPVLPPVEDTGTAPLTEGPAVSWAAIARTGWHRSDRDEIARRFEDALRVLDVVDAAVTLDGAAFSTSFTVTAHSELEAHEIALDRARRAWSTLGVVARPGADFEVSRFDVTRRDWGAE